MAEVLVAAVLLAVGIAGCLSALSTAVRFRSTAMAREALADAAGGRLSWMASPACPSGDTVFTSISDARVHEQWTVTRDSGSARLVGEARVEVAGRHHALRLDTRVRCD